MSLRFQLKARNELEQTGRSSLPLPGGPEVSCPNCHRILKTQAVRENAGTCACGHHFRISARERIALLTDTDSFFELFSELEAGDPLSFPTYQEKLRKAELTTGERESVVTGYARISGQECCLFIMEPGFMMGSLGSGTGEKLTRLFELATAKRLPVIGVTVSGGARMQEGLVSLMQMAKVSGAVMRHSQAGLFYLTLLTDPTTGGVTASFATEGDVILAEPGATIGFAGARVIEQTTKKSLPKGFQTAESMLRHGFIDGIVNRKAEKRTIALLLRMHTGK